MDSPPTTPTTTRNLDGAFGGSFAGTGRDIAPLLVRPWYLRKEYYLDGWADPVIWRSAVSFRESQSTRSYKAADGLCQLVECLATTCSIYISGQFGMTLMNSGTTFVLGYVGVFNAVFLSLFIYATATATGGHLNPMITFTTILCGLTPVPRGMRVLPSLWRTCG
jgi:hypothetical protein